MKELIANFILQNDHVLEVLRHLGRDVENIDKNINLYVELLPKANFNAALGVHFATMLQLTNKKEVFEQYDFDDISKLFDSLIKLQSFNLDTYLESAHFEWSVVNNNDKAKQIIADGCDKARQKINELTKLLDEINND